MLQLQNQVKNFQKVEIFDLDISPEYEAEIFKFIVENGIFSEFCIVLNKNKNFELLIFVLDILIDISAINDENLLTQAFLETAIIQRIVKFLNLNISNEQIVYKCLQIITNICIDPKIGDLSRNELNKTEVFPVILKVFDLKFDLELYHVISLCVSALTENLKEIKNEGSIQ